MSKNKTPLPPEQYYVKLTNLMIKGYAWNRLSGDAIKIYIKMRTVGGFRLENKFSLKFSEIEEKLNIPQRHIRPAINELVELGFVIIAEHGGKTGNSWNMNRYEMSDKWSHCTPTYHTGPHIEPKKREGSLTPKKKVGNIAPFAEYHVDSSGTHHVDSSAYIPRGQ